MTIIEKIKQSIEGATGMPFLYHAAGELNELIARCSSLPVAYSFLIDSGTIDDVNGRYHERVTLAVMFCDKTEFDFNALENEQIIDRMKVKAYKWMQSLRMSNALHVVSVNNTQRLYDNTTDVLTGFAVNITIEDIAGVGECELPQVVFEVKENGAYPVVGIDEVIVSIPNSLTDLVATENSKEYFPADYGVHGFGSVKTEIPKVKVSRLMVSDGCINDDGIWEGERLIDTSECTSFADAFLNNGKIKRLNASGWNTSKVTDLSRFLCNTLVNYLDITGWDTSKVKSFDRVIGRGGWSSLKLVGYEYLDTSNATIMSVFASQINVNNGILDFRKWVAYKVTTFNVATMTTYHLIKTLVGGESIESVIANDTTIFKGLKVGFNSGNRFYIEDRASLRALINGLADLTGQTPQTLAINKKITAGQTTSAFDTLTEEDIAIAVAKNWTITSVN